MSKLNKAHCSGEGNRFCEANPESLFLQNIKLLIQKIQADDCQGLAAEMTYRLMMSLIPGFLFLFSLFGLIGKQMDMLPFALEFIKQMAPTHAVSLIQDLLTGLVQTSSGELTLAGLLISLWSAAGGASVLIKGVNRASGIPAHQIRFWYVSLTSMIIMASLGVMIVVASNLIIFGNVIIEWMGRLFALSFNMLFLLEAVRWVIIVGGITLLTDFTYALLLKSHYQKWAWKNAFSGALFFVLSWIGISLLFALYVEKMNRFNPVYGAISGVILLMTWLYLSSLMLLIGGEISAFTTRKRLKSDKGIA